MSKYEALSQFLVASSQATISLSFSDIETILGFTLPHSAYTYHAWWFGSSHVQANSWNNAGYVIDELDIPSRRVVFRRNGVRTQKSAVAKSPQKQAHVAHKQAAGSNFISTTAHPHNLLSVCGYNFCFVQFLVPECENGNVMEFYPQNDYPNPNRKPLLFHGSGAFCRFTINAPAAPGVYLWVVKNEIIYIGETVNLQQRFNNGYGNISPINCYAGGQSTNCKMNKVVMEYYKKGQPVALYFHQTTDNKQVELTLLRNIKTKYNVKDN